MSNSNSITPEKVSYRIAMVPTGVTHPILGVLPDQGSLPVPMQGTGTVATVNNDPNNGCLVIGTGTSFLNDPQVGSKTKFSGQVFEGDYIAVNSAGQFLRRIVGVESDTRLRIEAPFPSSLNGNFYIVKKTPFKRIRAFGAGSVASKLQEQSFAQNEVFESGGAPITYACNAANNAINFQLDY